MLTTQLTVLLCISFSISTLYCYSLYQTHPYFTSFFYALISNRISNIVIWFSIISLLIAITYVLYQVFIGKLDTDEVEDVNHMVKYVLADMVMNVAFLQSHIDSHIWVIIILSLAIRCLISVCKVRLNNIGRNLNLSSYFRFFILLNILMGLTLCTIIKYHRLLIYVTSAKSLFAFELLSGLITISELLVKFVIDSVTIFFNNALSHLDPEVIYSARGVAPVTPTPGQPPAVIPQPHQLPAWYRYFFGYRPVYRAIRYVAQNNLLLDTLNTLSGALIKMFLSLYILINFYTIILPVYTLRRIVSSFSKLYGAMGKLNNIMNVRGSLQLMFKRLRTYEVTYLTSEEVCGVCLVDFEDDCNEAKEKLADVGFYDYVKYYLFDDGKQKGVHKSHRHTNFHSSEVSESRNISADFHPFLTSAEIPSAEDYAAIVKVRDELCSIGHLSCGHYYHNDCIREWLNRDGRCPVCRTQSLSVFRKPALHMEKLKKEESTIKKEMRQEYKESLREALRKNDENNSNTNEILVVKNSNNSETIKTSSTNDNVINQCNDSSRPTCLQTTQHELDRASRLAHIQQQQSHGGIIPVTISDYITLKNVEHVQKQKHEDDTQPADTKENLGTPLTKKPKNVVDQGHTISLPPSTPTTSLTNDINDQLSSITSNTVDIDQNNPNFPLFEPNTHNITDNIIIPQPIVAINSISSQSTSLEPTLPQNDGNNTLLLNSTFSSSSSTFSSSPSDGFLSLDQRRMNRLKEQNEMREKAIAEQKLKRQGSLLLSPSIDNIASNLSSNNPSSPYDDTVSPLSPRNMDISEKLVKIDNNSEVTLEDLIHYLSQVDNFGKPIIDKNKSQKPDNMIIEEKVDKQAPTIDDQNIEKNVNHIELYNSLAPAAQRNVDMLSKQVSSLQQQLVVLFQRKNGLISQNVDIMQQMKQTDEDIALIQTLILENIAMQTDTLINQ